MDSFRALEAKAAQGYALRSTYEISCLTNMANVVRDLADIGIIIPPGTMISIVDKSTDAGTKDVARVKTIERATQLVKLGFRPMPHFAARRYESVGQLSGFVSELLRVGVDGFLLLAGDETVSFQVREMTFFPLW